MTLVISGKANHDRLMKLNIEDLVPPEEVKVTIGTKEKPIEFIMSGWNLKMRILILEKFTEKELTEIIEKIKIKELAEIAYVLLKDKEKYPTFYDFAEIFRGVNDFVQLSKGICATIGLGEKVLNQIIAEQSKKKPPVTIKKKPTGARSSTK